MIDRDDRLGAALRDLPVPDHAPEFAAQLRTRLNAAAPLAPSPDQCGSAPPRGGWIRSGRRGRGPQRLRIGAGLLAGLAVVALVLLLLAPGGEGPARLPLGAQPATAAQLGIRVETALARIDALSAVLVVRARDASDVPFRTTRSRLWLTSAGDERAIPLGGGGGGAGEPDGTAGAAGAAEEVAFDAATGVEWRQGGGVPGVTRTKGLAPGPPDRASSVRGVQRQLGGVARALRAAGTAPVRRLTYAGRPAWRISVPAEIDVHALPGDTGDRVEITVDRATGLPLRVRETWRGRFVSERRLEQVRVDPRVPAGTFAPAPVTPPGELGVSVDHFDGGFRHLPLGQAHRAVGYAPLHPSVLAHGFRRAETAVAATTPSPTGAEGMNPPSRDVVSTAYRRGLSAFYVTTRAAGANPRAWADPVAAPEGFLVRPERVCFRRGVLAGSCGELLVDPRATPHVWAVSGGLVVTIAGDLTRGELLALAASLTRAP